MSDSNHDVHRNREQHWATDEAAWVEMQEKYRQRGTEILRLHHKLQRVERALNNIADDCEIDGHGCKTHKTYDGPYCTVVEDLRTELNRYVEEPASPSVPEKEEAAAG